MVPRNSHGAESVSIARSGSRMFAIIDDRIFRISPEPGKIGMGDAPPVRTMTIVRNIADPVVSCRHLLG